MCGRADKLVRRAGGSPQCLWRCAYVAARLRPSKERAHEIGRGDIRDCPGDAVRRWNSRPGADLAGGRLAFPGRALRHVPQHEGRDRRRQPAARAGGRGSAGHLRQPADGRDAVPRGAQRQLGLQLRLALHGSRGGHRAGHAHRGRRGGSIAAGLGDRGPAPAGAVVRARRRRHVQQDRRGRRHRRAGHHRSELHGERRPHRGMDRPDRRGARHVAVR
jgi:hypothetical protein